jgi:hypothetical protein
MQLINTFHTLPREDYAMIQNEALRHISLVEQMEGKEFESVIVARNGTGAFAFDWLEDANTVFQLTDLQVVFNLTPFFTERPSSSPPVPPA